MAIQEATQWPGVGGSHRISAGSRAVSPRQQGDAPRGGEMLATALGWFSIGLGLAELAMPRSVAQMIGVNDNEQNRGVLRAVGLRELASGVAILTRPRPAGWVWSRVGGDAMDLALLGAAFASEQSRKDRLAAATAAVLGVAALDIICGERMSGDGQSGRGARGGGMLRQFLGAAKTEHGIRVHKVVTIEKPADELYRYWRDFENLPRFMRYLESVRKMDERRSHWVAKAPMGRTVAWDAEITEDRPNERIAWHSLPGADVDNSGAVAFAAAPGGRGTVVRVELEYNPPGGVIGATIARAFGKEPGQQVQEDLRRFKQVMELGEIVQSEATVKGGGPARPPREKPATTMGAPR